MGFRGPVDAVEPVALSLHRAAPHAVGAAAMPTVPCTGAQGRRLPRGPSPRPLAGARVPPRCSKHRGWLVAPGKLGLPPWCGGVLPEYHAAARIVIASMLARASTGVR